MAGRKPTPKPDLISMLLEKMGVPVQKKGKKGTGKRRKGQPGAPRPKRPAIVDGAMADDGLDTGPMPAFGSDYGAGELPFGDYAGGSAGLGFGDPATDVSYEAAAAAGYAPVTPMSFEAAVEEQSAVAASLPNFSGLNDAAVPPPPAGKLFSDEALDNSLDTLFSNLEAGTGFAVPDPAPAVEEKVVPFPGPKAAPEPIRPLMPDPEPVAEAPQVDTPAVSAVKLAPVQPVAYPSNGEALTVPDVLPLSQGVNLRALLATIDHTPGVAGSLLVGYDGLIITTTLPPEVDCEYLGAQACNLFTTTNVQTQRIKRGELRRMILESANGVMLVTAADMGILVVVSRDGQAMDSALVMGAIAGALGRT